MSFVAAAKLKAVPVAECLPPYEGEVLLIGPDQVRTSLLFDSPHLRGLTCARNMTDYRAFIVSMLQTARPRGH